MNKYILKYVVGVRLLLLWRLIVVTYCLSTNTTPARKSLGQSIQSVNTFQEGLDVAGQFWLPTDADLPPHYKQPVHHDT